MLRPVAPRPAARRRAPGVGRRVMHLPKCHRPRDVRIFHKRPGARPLRRVGGRSPQPRNRPPPHPFRWSDGGLFGRPGAARRRRPGHGHGPVTAARRACGCARTRAGRLRRSRVSRPDARTKPWLSAALRLPFALAARGRARGRPAAGGGRHLQRVPRRTLARRTAPRVSVANSPWSTASPASRPPASRSCVRGRIGPCAASPDCARRSQVEVPGAAWMAGPGDRASCPPTWEQSGVVDPPRCLGLSPGARWRGSPAEPRNYHRAVPTKLVEAVGAGRPLSPAIRRTRHRARRRCGARRAAADAAAHAHALTHLLATSDKAAAMGPRPGGVPRRPDFDPEARSLTVPTPNPHVATAM